MEVTEVKEVSSKKKKLQCSFCCKTARSQALLDRHLLSHSPKKVYMCPSCGACFRKQSTLSQHKVIHSTTRPYRCDICDKSFNRTSTLAMHLRTHTGKFQFTCKVCKKGFHQKGNLQHHMYTHTLVKPYECHVCQKSFNQKSNLTNHLKRMHYSECLKTCKFCPAKFEKQCELRDHMNAHIEEAPKRQSRQPTKSAICIPKIETTAAQLTELCGLTPFVILVVGDSKIIMRVHESKGKFYLSEAVMEDIRGASISGPLDDYQVACVAEVHHSLSEEGFKTFEPQCDYLEVSPIDGTFKEKVYQNASTESVWLLKVEKEEEVLVEELYADLSFLNNKENEIFLSDFELKLQDLGGFPY